MTSSYLHSRYCPEPQCLLFDETIHYKDIERKLKHFFVEMRCENYKGSKQEWIKSSPEDIKKKYDAIKDEMEKARLKMIEMFSKPIIKNRDSEVSVSNNIPKHTKEHQEGSDEDRLQELLDILEDLSDSDRDTLESIVFNDSNMQKINKEILDRFSMESLSSLCSILGIIIDGESREELIEILKLNY